MIQTSEQIDAISAALVNAQKAIRNVTKSGKNPHFKSTYATLADVLDEVRPKFAHFGVYIMQAAINGEGANIGVTTRLLHSSGQWIESTLYVAPMKFDAQGAGSAIKYLRRYALMSMAGLGDEEDDDGEAAVAQPQPQRVGMVRAPDVGSVYAAASGHPQEPPKNGNGTQSVQQRAEIFRKEMQERFAKCKVPADVAVVIKNNGKALDGLNKMAPDVYAEIMAEANAITNAMYASA